MATFSHKATIFIETGIDDPFNSYMDREDKITAKAFELEQSENVNINIQGSGPCFEMCIEAESESLEDLKRFTEKMERYIKRFKNCNIL